MENVTVRFEADTLAQIDTTAQEEKRSRSQTIRILTEEALTARAERRTGKEQA